MPKYLLDSNVFMEAKNRYYGFDIAPGFWKWLEQSFYLGHISSIRKVKEELTKGTDELAKWALENPGMFPEIDALTVSRFEELATWAQSRNYNHSALKDFTGDVADFQLIAHASAHGFTLVTHEQSHPESRKRVMIPDACKAMNVPTCNTFDMLKSLNAVFDLRVDGP